MGIIPPGTQLSARDPDVAAWDSLSDDERRLYARMMEVFAGFLEHTDQQIGRLLDFLAKVGELDNTIIMVISDNGASAEGGPHGSFNENLFFNNVPETLEDGAAGDRRAGRAEVLQPLPLGLGLGRQHAVPALEARDLPRRHRRPVHRPLAARASPPGARSAASTRTSSTWSRRCWRRSASTPPSAIRGVTQSPIEGVCFAHTFGDAKAETRHHTQYFEMFGHRSLYHDGWRAVCPVPGPSFTEAGMGFGELEITEEKLRELDAKGWELYQLTEDFAETREPGRRSTGTS